MVKLIIYKHGNMTSPVEKIFKFYTDGILVFVEFCGNNIFHEDTKENASGCFF